MFLLFWCLSEKYSNSLINEVFLVRKRKYSVTLCYILAANIFCFILNIVSSFFVCLFLIFRPIVVDDHYNPRLVKDLLQDLSSQLHNMAIHVGRCVLVGNINIWLRRQETILKWQQQLNNLQIPKVEVV